MGKDLQGQFRTTALKEYPADLSAAFAGSMADQVRDDLRTNNVRRISDWETNPKFAEVCDWVLKVAEAGRFIRADASILPDYQPR